MEDNYSIFTQWNSSQKKETKEMTTNIPNNMDECQKHHAHS